MNLRKTIIFVVILLVVALVAYSSIAGINLGKYKIASARDEIELGLDLAGGVYVVLEAQTDASGAELDKMMSQVKSIINQRVDGLGVSEPNITIEGKNKDRIRVELPGVDNAQQAIDIIGRTAQLQFVDPEGNIVVTGENVKKSEVAYQSDDFGRQVAVVALGFDKEGTKAFAEKTTELAGKINSQEKIIFIVLDDEVISDPGVEEPITNGEAVITQRGGYELEEAKELANLIRAGALPVEMKEVETSVIGPTLGLESLDKSIFAAGIGLMLIFLFMLIYYKISGFVADTALIIYILLVIGAMIGMNAKLTLPGIAGLILSIGMAVDANVVIFERIKEEIRTGKTLRSSVDAGYKRALTTVLDANVTTFIAGLVLFYVGRGPIRGFAVTLLIGLVASMLTSVFITKFLLKTVIGMNITKNKKLFGA